jgi:hypothetical protein
VVHENDRRDIRILKVAVKETLDTGRAYQVFVVGIVK